MRLLISCRDPAAAAQIAALWPAIIADPRFMPVLIAQQPALAILRRQGLSALEIPHLTATTEMDAAAVELRALARDLLDDLQPDVLLCGVSGPEAGIDEALLAMRGTRAAFAIQDFWGDANPILGRLADLYFVPDQYAVEVTKQRHGAAALASGQPRYLPYVGLDVAAMAAELRGQYGINAGQRILSYFGQPLDHLPGYAGFADAVAQAVWETDQHATLILRPHPKQAPELLAGCAAAWRRRGLDCRMTSEGSAEPLLAASDATFSAFSTSGMDAVMLARTSGVLTAVPIYLNYGAPAEFFAEASGFRRMPLVDLGAALETSTPTGIAQTLTQALDSKTREQLAAAIRHALPSQGPEAAHAILNAMATGRMPARNGS